VDLHGSIKGLGSKDLMNHPAASSGVSSKALNAPRGGEYDSCENLRLAGVGLEILQNVFLFSSFD